MENDVHSKKWFVKKRAKKESLSNDSYLIHNFCNRDEFFAIIR